jgi:cellulose synthase operon protein C
MDAFSSSASGNPAPSSLKGSEPGARASGGDRSETLATVRRLYDAGLYLQALDASEPLGHLRHWAGIDERLLAARLALQLGAPRLSLRHRLRAWREAADHPEVAYYRAALVSEYEGPYACWWFLGSHGDLPDAAPDIRASWFCLHAFCLGTLRDFDRAETWLDRAAAADPGNPWIATSRATLFLQQDRLEEAIAADDEALGLHPWFRPAVQSRFSLLALANRDAEAFDFLREATGRLECAALHLQLAPLLAERDDFAGAEAAIDCYESLSPLLERSSADGFLHMRSYLAYRRGDDVQAIDCARRTGDDIGRKMADRLSAPERAGLPRLVLPLPFIRQHHHTCAPTTLAIISRFWGRPAEHVEVAERICYDGTSNLSERRWAESNGWAVREFTVTEAATGAAIAAGIPFTLTTTDAGSSHLQAVAGIDHRRGSIIIRDPGTPLLRELFFDDLGARYGAFGPRGMAMVPIDERARLDALELPDSAEWETLFHIDGFLQDHRRADAAALVDQLRGRHPDHVVTFLARRRLASYDADPLADLPVVETLLDRFPDNDLLKLTRLSILRSTSRRGERLAALEAECRRNDAHPIYSSILAQELAVDSTQLDKAMRHARRAMRFNPADASLASTLARMRWNALDFDAGLELYRFAACLDDKDEAFADAYFRAARHCRRTEEALEHLRLRNERFGDKSGQPARTLDAALASLERTAEGMAVLEAALARRPADGELILAAAWSALAMPGGLARARRYLAQARGKTAEVAWLQCAGGIESYAGNRAGAIDFARRAAEAQPLAAGLHAAVATGLAEEGDRRAALNYLAGIGERFPHHQPLIELRIEWLRGEPAEVREPVIRRLLELNPANAWATRELGFLLAEERRFEEAAELCEHAAALDPHHVARFHLRATIAQAQGDTAAAKQAHREAIRISIDDDYAIDGLLAACHTRIERHEALAFVRAEIIAQPIYGDGLLSYRHHAEGVLAPEELLEHLTEAHAARPDLWHAWVALARQHLVMEKLDDASTTIRIACERFPLLPRVWFDRSRISRMRDDTDDERASLERALEINPRWHEAIRLLSDLHERRGDRAAARRILERAVRFDVGNGVSHGWLADCLWRLGERDDALTRIEQAVDLTPHYEWGWDRLRDWSLELGQPERAVAAARRFVERLPRDPQAWVQLSKTLPETDAEDRVEAIRQARRLAPFDAELASLEARILTDAGRLEEALEVCRSPLTGEVVPPFLTAREAWILWHQGEQQDAIATLRRALAADPSMAASWRMLTGWLMAVGTPAEQVEAARQLVRLDPYEPSGLELLGDALLASGDKLAAREVFGRCYDIAPSVAYAGVRLFDLCFDAGDSTAARGVLERMLIHCPDAWVYACGVRLAAAEDDFPLAASLLPRICLETPVIPHQLNSWPIQAATEAVESRGWGRKSAEVIGPLLDIPRCHPQSAAMFIRCIAPRGGLEGYLRARFMVGRRYGGQAMLAWVEASQQAGDLVGFRRLVTKDADLLMHDQAAWGAATLGWTLFRAWETALPWGLAWREHPDAPSWMLANVAEILRVHGQHEEAAAVSARAVELEGDYPKMLHALWLATDRLRAGDEASIAALLAAAPREKLDVDYAFVRDCLETCAEFAALSRRERRRQFRASGARLVAIGNAYPNMRSEPARREVYTLAVRRLAALAGGIRSHVWRFVILDQLRSR